MYMKKRLRFGLIAIAFLTCLGTAMALSFSAGSGGSAGSTSFSGNYELDDSTTLLSSINLDSGSIFKEMKAQGSGQNILDESVSTKEKSVQNTILSFGSMSTSSSSFGSSDGVVVNHDANLAGDVGFVGTKSVSPTNQMSVAGGFEGTGALNERISSSSGDVASVGGTVSSAGVDLLNDEISQALSSGENGMSIEGVSKSEDGTIGKFGLAAVNQARIPRPPQPPIGTAVGPNALTSISDPGDAGEIMTNIAYLGSESSNIQLAWRIDSPLQLYLRQDRNLAGENLDPITTGKSIATAAATWEHWTSKDLFAGGTAGDPSVTVSSNAVADRGDGYSVHAFKPISRSAIAYARTWTSNNIVVESDVCYNTRLQWTMDWNTAKTGYPVVDVQSIALHELGHATGLGDLYLLPPEDPRYSDWYQIMNSYDGPQRYLGAGDIAGLQTKYGT